VIGAAGRPGEENGPAPGNQCLITGGTGFIGGHLVQRLVRDGQEVRCLVRKSSDTALLRTLGVELVTGDLTNPSSLERAVAGCRFVFHCGAFVSDWGTPKEIAAVNVQGTRNLLRASVAAGIERVVHFSTTDVYGYPDGGAIDETYRASRFRNWYAQTKLAAEAEVRRAQATNSLEAVVLRPATVYGPGSIEVVGEIARAVRNGTMLLIGGGRAVAGLCYVENLIDFAVLVQRHPAAPGQAFNVSDGLQITWDAFIANLANGLGCAPPRWSIPYSVASATGFTLEHGYRLLRGATGLRMRPLLSRQAVQVMGTSQDFSVRKAREVIGWEPRIDYPAGLEATLGWLRAQQRE
jgi:nucleoside-diphosphate-sugar epimerase